MSLGWTAVADNVGVARYDVYRSTVVGLHPVAREPDRPAGRDQLSGHRAGAGTYYYVVKAEDAAGNLSPALEPGERDHRLERYDAADRRRSRRPQPAEHVTATVTLTATASDNIGVVGVQFKLDGQILGARTRRRRSR